MQKVLLLLLFAAAALSHGSAQTNSTNAQWTPENKVVLASLPASGEDVLLPVRPDWSGRTDELKSICGKISNQFTQWNLSEDGKNFRITLERGNFPEWTEKDWEMYLNRVVSAYFPKE